MPDYIPSADLQSDFKAAMRRFAATVSIISTSCDGMRHGMVATAVQSLSVDPPSLLICVNQSASLHAPLRRSGRFAVNMLHTGHAPLVPLFSGRLKGGERFGHGDWLEVEGLPVLADAQAALCCQVETSLIYGSHEVVIGRVLSLQVLRQIDPLLYQDGRLAGSRVLEG